MLGLEAERIALIDVVATLYRVPVKDLTEADMVTLLDMIAEAIK